MQFTILFGKKIKNNGGMVLGPKCAHCLATILIQNWCVLRVIMCGLVQSRVDAGGSRAPWRVEGNWQGLREKKGKRARRRGSCRGKSKISIWEKVGHARKRGDPTTGVTKNMETLLQFISAKAWGFKRGSRSRNNSGRHSTDPLDVRNEARHLWTAHSVVTSFTGGHHNVSRVFTLWPPASSASPTRGGQQSSTVAPPTDTRSRIVIIVGTGSVGKSKSSTESQKSKIKSQESRKSQKSEVQSQKSQGPKVPRFQANYLKNQIEK